MLGTKNAAGPSTQFISYKNWLQEHCQKHHLPVPSYKTERGPEFGFIGFVSFGANQMKSSVPMPTAKEAEQRVAFEALKNAQVLPNHAEFNVPLTAMNPGESFKSCNHLALLFRYVVYQGTKVCFFLSLM